MEENYWTGLAQRLDRRTVLRGALISGAGLGAAALMGCGDADEVSPEEPSAASSSPSSSGGSTGSGASPSGSADGAPVRGGVLIHGEVADLTQHDMHTALGGTIWHHISERAFELDHATGELEGRLVDEWEVVDDTATEFVLHVREGVYLHDKEPWNGREFNAEDLAFNLERIAGFTADAEGIPITSFQRRSMLPGLVSAEAIDDYHVNVKLDRPGGSFLNGLAEIRNQLMPKGVVEVGFADSTKFAGPGAFEIVSHEPGSRMEYRRHERFYNPEQPYFDGQVVIIVPDRASTVAAFVSGQIHYLRTPQPHEEEAIRSSVPDAQHYGWLGPHWDHFRFNFNNPQFQDFRVRKAFQLAINYEELMDGTYGAGLWDWMAVGHPGFPGTWQEEKVKSLPGYNPATKDEDRAEATRMLDAAGYANGAGLDFTVLFRPDIPAHEEHSLRWQADMGNLWGDLNISLQRASDGAAFASQQSARDFDAITYVITAVPDLYLEWHSQHHSDGSRNYGGFENADADALIERGLEAVDPEARAEVAEEFQQKYVEEWMPTIVLGPRNERFILQPNFRGFDATSGPWGFGSYMMRNDAHRWWFAD